METIASKIETIGPIQAVMTKANKIRFLHTGGMKGGTGKTGPIKCDGGFTVRFKLIEPQPGKDIWINAQVFLHSSQYPVDDDLIGYINSVENKEDPNFRLYGTSGYTLTFNLKTKTKGADRLSKDETIELTYLKKEGKVRFVAKTFDFY